ncbi:TrbC/VirB2 family protein [Salipiger sp. P9]|jgi:type IV secretion system protein VirB2|uniref:VIRB2 type IV secretion n=1 Tax=Roseovarius atlanticus TaxID=1641875 RepID=A0A0T5NPD4_9RHOB|nr:MULTISPECIES: TrbC/VirB2 family protein [Roseobacteraceae]KRS10575.1 VIRB2 type IV secretion [Roseovarius atlanticus]MCR8548490.1 TrbC/VirB2 family protein [Salipiger pentaromativorans]
MTSRKRQSVLRTRAIVTLGATALIVLAGPALAQSIDLSPVQTLLQGIVDAITGPLGIVIGTLALIGVFLSWLFGILDFRQALWVVVAIAGIAAAPTIVAAIWTT